MKKILILFLLAGVPSVTLAAGAGVKLDPVRVDLHDQDSLQRGARIFVNYCLSCHSAAYMRYNRMGRDLGISDELVTENLLFAADKIGDLMKAVMPRDDAKAWFGVAPPDLTLVSRSHGPEWIYTYLRSFYRDDKSPSGWNNTVFPNVAMPHVLYEWQGHQRAVFKTEHGAKVFERFELERPGTMVREQYDAAMRDLTNFMVYLGEPAKLVRYRLGIYVIFFLLVFLIFAYLLKREYWKDVH
ncbi:MAG: cytochrome C [Candidatus Muproteobacteria bacterium RBG_16_65_31]|uniref:Cytochrome C n=1 Tax=Candidatus Muproteobacteria bacterium RBG_16_65_31 TaxID=1817759 RepID=A0A1F6TAL5_9PROT|nr:MAG: cytochrome C [Candidatus Muproteobacteria bacterium RBG_16_65_31]